MLALRSLEIPTSLIPNKNIRKELIKQETAFSTSVEGKHSGRKIKKQEPYTPQRGKGFLKKRKVLHLYRI
jgi:hypothetical protein